MAEGESLLFLVKRLQLRKDDRKLDNSNSSTKLILACYLICLEQFRYSESCTVRRVLHLFLTNLEPQAST